jgi:hypothetical protein
MQMKLDFNDAPAQATRGIIPARTQVHVIAAVKSGGDGPDGSVKFTSTGLVMLELELTVTEGDYKGRKLWERLFLDVAPGYAATEPQQKAINGSRATVRAIIEAARNIASTDMSPAAVAARTISTPYDLDNMEFWIEVGVEKDKTGQYPDKNRIGRVINGADKATRPTAGAGFGGPKTEAVGARPTGGAKAGWA